MDAGAKNPLPRSNWSTVWIATCHCSLVHKKPFLEVFISLVIHRLTDWWILIMWNQITNVTYCKLILINFHTNCSVTAGRLVEYYYWKNWMTTCKAHCVISNNVIWLTYSKNQNIIFLYFILIIHYNAISSTRKTFNSILST